MKVVRNPSMQMEEFDRPVRSVNCYDNVENAALQRAPLFNLIALRKAKTPVLAFLSAIGLKVEFIVPSCHSKLISIYNNNSLASQKCH